MTDAPTNDQELVDRLEEVWTSIDSMCANLNEEQWKTPTDLPGWSVQDNVVHISAIESTILGRPDPDHTPPDYDHVKNDAGQHNEVWVDSRRSWSGAQVLDEFREVTGARLRQLRGLTPSDFDAESWTPAGPGTVRDLLPFRIFDSWAHEQDIRRAVDQPCDFSSPAGELSFARVVSALPYVVGKKVAPPDGTTVVFDVTGSRPMTIAIGVDGGRAKPLSTAPERATVTLAMDAQTLACLGLGRWDPAAALDDDQVTITGDEKLGRAVVGQMNFMF
ncbi:MAG TPA: maleylpyruvate isomerase family mycothiol-dependent enzyme [Acidimicrobiia bacterium]|nr:maleylpyruvate isomerase family mycothiol-dependent enzyme [Acidimicrobiia bacterium]